MFEMQKPHTGSTGSKTREAHIVQFCTTSTCYMVNVLFSMRPDQLIELYRNITGSRNEEAKQFSRARSP